MKLAATIAALVIAPFLSFGQDERSEPLVAHHYKFDHYLSVQINELTKQILSVNNSNTVNDNPFLLTYNLNEQKSGWGLRAGFGANSKKSASNTTVSQGGYTQNSNLNALNVRVGGEKAFQLTDKWSAGAGLDVVYRYSKYTSTFSYQGGSYDSDSTLTTAKTGFGAMGWLRYSFSKHVLVGTEMSYYFLTGNIKTKTANQGPFGGDLELNSKISEGKFNLPVVFYLTLKL